MKAPDDSDDDDAEDDGDDGDFDGVSHRILVVPPRLCKCDYTQTTTTIPVQRWISIRMDILVPQIPTPVRFLVFLIGPISEAADQWSRYILFKGQARGSYRSRGRPRDHHHS